MALQDNALVTLVQVQDALTRQGIDTTGQDDYLEELINSMSDQFEQYCGRVFREQVITGYELKGTDRNEIVLPNRPVTSIQKIVLDDVELDTKVNDEFGGYYIKTDSNGKLGWSGRIGRQMGWWANGYVNNALEFTRDPDRRIISIVVDYTGGFDPIPSNLQRAAIKEITREYTGEEDGFRNITSEKIQSVSQSFEKSDIDKRTGWTNKTMTTLKMYKVLVIL